MKKQLITLFFILQMLPGWNNSRATSITDSLLTRHSTGTQICTAAIQRGEIAEQQVIHLRWRILPDPLLLQ